MKIIDSQVHFWDPALLRYPWSDNLDNVCCKLSGVLTEADWATWTADGIRPYLDHAFNRFGIDRVMFGNDWPVINLAGSFTAWIDTLLVVLPELDEAEKEKLFCVNVQQFYGAQEDG
jgi:L-fuconolactonase